MPEGPADVNTSKPSKQAIVKVALKEPAVSSKLPAQCTQEQEPKEVTHTRRSKRGSGVGGGGSEGVEQVREVEVRGVEQVEEVEPVARRRGVTPPGGHSGSQRQSLGSNCGDIGISSFA